MFKFDEHTTDAMTVANLNLPAFPTFDLTEKDTLKTRWNKYLKHFNTLCNVIGVTVDGQKLSMLLTYIGYEMYKIHENIITVEEPTLAQVNAASEVHFAPTSNPAYECYLFLQLKQRQDETIHEFYIRLKEQGQKCGFTNLNREIKQQVELATCSNKLQRYSFQNPDKSLSELLTIAKSFEDMKIYVDEVEKPDMHPINALCGTIYPHEVKCPAESKVFNKSKKVGHYVKCCKTKLTQKNDNHKDNSRQNPHPEQTLNRVTHSPSVPKEHKNIFVDEVYSDNDEYLFAVKDLFKDQVFETRENFITTVKIANQNVAALVYTGASVNILNMRTFTEINNRLEKPLNLKRTKDDPHLKILGEVDTVIETKTKFLESKFFVAETENINLLLGVTSLALGMIKIDKSEHMCFTISNKKNGYA